MKAVAHIDEHYREIADRTQPLIRRHFENQGIEFKIYSHLLDPDLEYSHANVCWNRIPILLRELPADEFIIWTDADIVYKTEFDWQSYVASSPSNVNIWVSSEVKPHRDDVCCGFMIFRNCPWTLDFLRTWAFLGPMREAKIGYYDHWNRFDQEAFNILWDWFESVHCRVQRIPESIVSNPRTPQAEHDASALFHFWGHSHKKMAFEILDNIRVCDPPF